MSVMIRTIGPVPRVIPRFSETFPKATLEVHEGLTEELVGKIVAAELDVAITSLPIHHSMVSTEELLSEPLLVAAAPQYDLAAQAVIQVRELDDLPFIALSEVHCLGEQIQSFCFQEDVRLNIVCHTSQLATVQNCIASGLGVSLVPRALAASDPGGRVVYREISDELSVPTRT